MTDRELEQRIRTAVEHAAPDRFDSVLSSCGQQRKLTSVPVCQEHAGDQKEGAVIKMSENKKKNPKPKSARRGFAAIAAMAAVFVLCFGGYNLFRWNMTPQADSVVMLDVNPSLSLNVDAREKVLSAEALNEDAQDVLGNMELEDTTLEVAMYAIIGSMLQKGYLGDTQNAILVSVENEDTDRGEALQQKVTQVVTSAAENCSLDAAVLSQIVSADDAALVELSKEYNISLGKAALIQEVIAQVPTLTFEDLASMTINEIALIAASKNISSETVTQSGAASDKAYIGQEAALQQACDHAGVSVEDVLNMEVKFDSEHGVMVYEVEFETDTKKYEYEIDAATGEVLDYEAKGQKNSVNASGYIGADAAKKAALDHAGVASGDVLKIEAELDSDDHTMIYGVEFETSTKKYEYEIDAITGEVLTYEAKNRKNSSSTEEKTGSSSGTSTNSSYIGEAAAKEAALDYAGVTEGDTTYVECYLEYDDGEPVCYCVEFKVGKSKYKYEIDLYSGAVMESDVKDKEDKKEKEEKGSSGTASDSSDSDDTSDIGEDEALTAALDHAGVSESSIDGKHVQRHREGDKTVYEVTFGAGHNHYYYKIDAASGDVLKSSDH